MGGFDFNLAESKGSARAFQRNAHGQYADEQLQNMQKRICLIEFLRLCFVIVYQGGKANKKSRELESSRPKNLGGMILPWAGTRDGSECISKHY